MTSSKKDEQYFEPVEKVIWEFERGKRLNIDEVDTGTLEGKRVRAEVLVRLKERAASKKGVRQITAQS